MTCRAVLICPGRGTYNKPELGYLGRHHAGAPLLDTFDDLRRAEGQTPVTELDSAERFSSDTHTKGDTASPLIYACSYLDRMALADDIELVAVTGNSMGWYTALAAAGALSAEAGFQVVNTMGRLMQEASIGGQLVYPCTGADWRIDPARRAGLLDTVRQIDDGDAVLRLSIDLGGVLVLAVGLIAPASFMQHFIVFILSVFIGFQVIWNVAHSLHTPLMAVTNAISSIIILGALIQIGSSSVLITILAGLGIFMASINIFGGFLVTRRMLAMFQKS
jgi:hypothetical protein